MSAKDIFRQTRPFCIAKLALGGAMVLVLLVLLALLMGIGWIFGTVGMIIGLILWAGCIGAVRFAFMHYGGYLVKAGHVAVIAEAVKTGQVPANQVNYGKQLVMERFLTSNVYFAVDKLVGTAIKQIQNKLQKLGNKLDFIPGMGAITGLAKFFVDISLGYVDECCLGWTFYKKEQGAFQSAADGVVIYVQNWKTLLKDAAKTMGKVLLIMVAMFLVIFIPVGLLFKLLKWSALAAFLFACLVAWVVKFAFVDSYILCQMMTGYLQAAPNTPVTFDLYTKLCNLSTGFKELFQKGQAEGPRPAQAAPNAAASSAPGSFCGQCGTQNEPGAKFCGVCGNPM